MDKRTAPTEHMGKQIACGHDQDEQRNRQRIGAFANRTFADDVIDHPPGKQAAKPDQDRVHLGKRQHAWVDQIAFGTPVIHGDQKRKAGNPGEIGLVFEPVQFGRHGTGGDHPFVHMIKTTTMDHPGFTIDALIHARTLAQGQIQPHEIERRPDPGDARNQMRPAQDQIDPVLKQNIHGV